MELKKKKFLLNEKKENYLKIILLIFAFVLSISLIGSNGIANIQYNRPKTTNNDLKTNGITNTDTYVKISQLTGYKVDFMGYLGGSSDDYGRKVVVDQNENIYLTGYTTSSDFPTKNAWNTTYGGLEDAFVAKFDVNGQLLWSTYLGGSGTDEAMGIALDSNDNVIVVGQTTSANFPNLNAYQTNNRGGIDGFLTKFDTNGKLLFSTYIGGSNTDIASGVTVNNQNEIFVTGSTYSLSDFPLKNAWYSSPHAGSYMNFVSKYNQQGALISNTLIGGSAVDHAYGIASDGNGNVYIAGFTSSSDYPIVNSYQNTLKGTEDGFISEFNSTGSLVFSTFFGGTNNEIIYGIAVHSNTIGIVGVTYSNTSFPLKNAFDSMYGGGASDGFVAELTNTGQLNFGSYFNGSSADVSYSVSIDVNNALYVAGTTSSTDLHIQNALQNSNGGLSDMFMTKVDSNGTLVFNTYLGGVKNDGGYDNGIVITPHNNIVAVGSFSSYNLGTYNAYYTNCSGNNDAFIIKLTDLNSSQPTNSTITSSQNSQSSGITTVTVTDSGSNNGALDQQIVSNPIFSGAIGITILTLLLNTVLLLFRKK